MDSATYMQLDTGIVFDGRAVTALDGLSSLRASQMIRVAMNSAVVEGDYAVPIVKAMGLSYEKQESEYQQDFWDSIVQANLSKILGSKSFDDWNMDGGSGIDAKELEKHVDAATAKKLMAQFDADATARSPRRSSSWPSKGTKSRRRSRSGSRTISPRTRTRIGTRMAKAA